MKKVLVAVSLVVVMHAGVAHAAKYGSAGCGLGAMLIGDDPGLGQLVAATLNSLLFNQSFGISSGTLNCGTEALEDLRGSTKTYIEGNREVLARDIARGRGDTIVGLSAIAGCSDTQKVGVVLQSKYETIFPNEKASSDEVTDAVINTLRAEPALACKQLT